MSASWIAGERAVEHDELLRRQRPVEVGAADVRRDDDAAEDLGELLGIAQRARLDPVLQDEADREPEQHHREQAQATELAQQGEALRHSPSLIGRSGPDD